MKGTIIFKIEIATSHGGFALASNFISKLYNKEEMTKAQVAGITSILYNGADVLENRELAQYIVRHQNSFKPINKPELLNENIQQYSIAYCLWIKEENLLDLVDLQYGCLIKMFFGQQRIISILLGRDSWYFKASHYLIDINYQNKDFYNSIYYTGGEGHTCQRLQLQNVGGLKDFMPLHFFSAKTNILFEALENHMAKQDIVSALLGGEIVKNEYSPVMQGCLRLLEDAHSRIEETDIENVAELLCSGNVFSFFLFTFSFNQVFRSRKKDNKWKDIRQYYFKMRDYAAGCEQLTENVIHHSEAGCGGISIRFHKVGAEYLIRRYGKDVKGMPYLEVLITDYAGINTSGNMADNFRTHIEDDYADGFAELLPIDFLTNDFQEQDSERAQNIQDAFLRYYDKSSHIGKHLGLKIFRSIVEDNGGIFGFYSHHDHKPRQGENYRFYEYEMENGAAQCMPGTSYTIAFPLRKMVSSAVATRAEIGIDYNIHLENKVDLWMQEYACETENLKDFTFKFYGQEEKENIIQNLSIKLGRERLNTENKKRIIYLSMKGLTEEVAEYLIKAFLIAGNIRHVSDYVLYDCSKAFEQNFHNIMKVYFGMRELDYLYKNREFVIALYTEKPIEGSFIIPGHIGKTIWVNRKNSYAGDGYDRMGWMTNTASPHFSKGEEMGDIPPYDILQPVDGMSSDETIFERYTRQILDTDIQDKSFGCKITGTHMRLGSTIHIDQFYEAEMLFNNRLFACRFAYLLVRQIYEEQKLNGVDKVTLYSYALYSEILVVEILNLLKKIYPDKDFDYAILEREAEHRDFSPADRIRYSTKFESEQQQREHFRDRSVVCIVPINSTLKTHEKLIGFFCQQNPQFSRENLISNYALVLVGSKEENPYWEIDEKNRTFTNIKLNIQPAPHYFILCKVKYYEALGCPLCFPENPLDEVPLVEVNAASTIPNQSFGLYGTGNKGRKLTYQEIQKEEEYLSVLRDSLIYSHTQRGENHYLYYFKTDKLFLDNKREINEWLEGLIEKIQINSDDYHVLFCPAHFSNAGFLECVNRILFRGAALVIRVDVDKEYRSNIMTKYSNLASFISLLATERTDKPTIKVFYIDDSIITGRTFYRSKSLISSVVERYKSKKELVDVHIFEKIIVLLDRNSRQTRLQYIGCWDSKNKQEQQLDENYFAYRTLAISSMRNHGDSCTLCQLEREAKHLLEESATREMADYWKKEKEKFAVKPLRDKQEELMLEGSLMLRNEEQTHSKDKAFRRMFCSHIVSTKLSSDWHGNRKEEAVVCLLKLIIEDYNGRKQEKGKQEAFEYMLSYLKVISRPFLVFNKTLKEAVFDVQLVLTESLLHKQKVSVLLSRSHKDYLNKATSLFGKLVNEILYKDFSEKQKMDLLLLLMKQLTEMKSNYFIRTANIQKFTKFLEKYEESVKGKVYQQYLHQTKKLLGVSSDTSKSAWFSREISKVKGTLGLPQMVLEDLILENTRAYLDGIKKLNQNLAREQDITNFLCRERWYGMEYNRYLQWNQKIEQREVSEEDTRSFLMGMFRKGKESVPARDRDNLLRGEPGEVFNKYFDYVSKQHEKECESSYIEDLWTAAKKELRKAQYRDFNSILVDLDFCDEGGELDVDGAVSLMAGVELTRQCEALDKGDAHINKVEVVCFKVACLLEKIIRAKSVKIVMECPLECDEWEDRIRKQYNELAGKYLKAEESHALELNLQHKKEYLEIADSGICQQEKQEGDELERLEVIEEVEMEVAHNLAQYRENKEAQERGFYVDSERKYLIWEMGNQETQWGEQRRLLIYAQFYKLEFPRDWQLLRNLFCMNHIMNHSVFDTKDMDYLFELILADKERMMYNLDKAHSHTATAVRKTQCDLAKAGGEDGCYRSFVLTLLADLQVSQVYRQSLKGSYYCRNLPIHYRKCADVFKTLYDNKWLVAIDQSIVSLGEYLKVYSEFPQEGFLFEAETGLSEDDKMLTYAEANGGNEIFLLILALIMNAAGPNRGMRETIEGGEGIRVFLTKSEEGCLRIANECKVMKKDVNQINEELRFPPQGNQGISLWSVSRYVRSLISIRLSEELQAVRQRISKLPDSDSDLVMQELKNLRQVIETALGEEFFVKANIRQNKDGIKYFYMDIPILSEKYDALFTMGKKGKE